MGKEAKTNAMRILERAKVAYTAHEYPHEEGVAVDGIHVAQSMGQEALKLQMAAQRRLIDELDRVVERVLPHLTRLKVLVPERHDLVLMKAVRCYEHDLAAISEIHQRASLDLAVLVQRFEEEMTPIGEPTRIRNNFLVVVERLFPDAADTVARQLRKRR